MPPVKQLNFFQQKAQRERAAARKKDGVEEHRRKAVGPNIESAGIILRERERYGGDGSLMVMWAEMIEKKTGTGFLR